MDSAHNAAVARLQHQIRDYFVRKVPFRVYHGSTNSTKVLAFKRSEMVDISDMDHVLSIDTERCVAVVEPNVPMDKLVEATLKYGLVPPVVTEFPGITVGGAIQGAAAESASYRYGCFSQTINSIEMILGSASFIMPTVFTISLLTNASRIGQLLIVPALAVAFLGLTAQRPSKTDQKSAPSVLIKITASVTIAALIIGAHTAITALWLPPEHNKFVYSNTANGVGFTALILIVLLSYMQRDVYWISRTRSAKLDERQIKERQQVFETSYKIAAALLFAGVYILYSHKHSLPAIINDDVNFNVTPGNMFWPFLDVALTVFALPLFVAAYKKR